MTEEEEHLAALLAKDVDRHFRELVETYQQQLYRLMYRQVGSAPDAEDIVQETFLRAYYALRNYATQGVRLQQIRPWLYKIAFNLYYNRLRVVRPHIIPLDMDNGGILCELEHPDPGPEEVAGWQESFYEATQAISLLPERYRAVLNLYYFEQLSYQEIAELLQQPVGTVKSKVSRGLGLIRATLAEQRP